jgi:hypothetical protein
LPRRQLSAQEVRGRTERLDPELDRSKQAPEGFAHGFVVVDDEYGRLFASGEWASWTLDHWSSLRTAVSPANIALSCTIIEPGAAVRQDKIAGPTARSKPKYKRANQLDWPSNPKT